MAIEEPAYTVRHASGKIEYREYAPYLVAETLVDGETDFESAGNVAFGRLFRYISGDNTTRTKIAMTAPVSQQAGGEKIAMTVPVQQAGTRSGWRVAFTLPAKYSLETAPVPADSRIRIVREPARLLAVLRYSGRWTESSYNAGRDELLASLSAAGVGMRGEPQLARYNAPFVPPFMRRNEVMVEVDSYPAH
ncbi:MAG: heme-binding protein [Gammaproteobacteria bacterium]|nr:heme-binding protein [Gammaproteobacteria bacterium]